MNSNEVQNVKITNADPSALGLFGLAMVTLVASSQKLGLTDGLSFLIPCILFISDRFSLFLILSSKDEAFSFLVTISGI